MHVSGFKYREIADRLNLPLGTVKSRIFFTRQKLQEELSVGRIIDESKIDTSKVLLLTTVKIKNLKTGASMIYTIVPENEADLKSGKISVSSPIASGLLGKVVGDKVDITVPAGVMTFEIVEITL